MNGQEQENTAIGSLNPSERKSFADRVAAAQDAQDNNSAALIIAEAQQKLSEQWQELIDISEDDDFCEALAAYWVKFVYEPADSRQILLLNKLLPAAALFNLYQYWQRLKPHIKQQPPQLPDIVHRYPQAVERIKQDAAELGRIFNTEAVLIDMIIEQTAYHSFKTFEKEVEINNYPNRSKPLVEISMGEEIFHITRDQQGPYITHLDSRNHVVFQGSYDEFLDYMARIVA